MKSYFLKIIVACGIGLLLSGCTSIEPDGGDLINPGEPEKPVDPSGITYEVYDMPEGFLPDENPKSKIWKVSIIQNGVKKESPVFWSQCPAYQLGYQDMKPNDKATLDYFKDRTISWTTFSFEGKVTVEVEILDNSKVPASKNVNILPSRYGITPEVDGNIIRFEMDKPGYCSVEVGANGYKQGLMVFADPLMKDAPEEGAEGYAMIDKATVSNIATVDASKTGLYFKPGVHEIGVYQVPSNIKNIYIPGGAWVYGAIIMEDDKNSDVKIFGRGVLSARHLNYRESHSVEARNSSPGVSCSNRIVLDGITVADVKHFAVRLIGTDNKVGRVKCIGGWTYNCDGIAAFHNSVVSNCFIWANDDNIKVYRDNIKVSDIVCWQLDNGGVIQLGWTGPMATGVEIKRVDLLHAEYRQWQFNVGLISLVGNRYETAGASGWTKNMVIEDLVTETPIPVLFNITPDPFTPYTIDGLTLRNLKLKYSDTFNSQNRIEERQEGHHFSGLIFDNVVVNGTKLNSGNWKSVGNFSEKSIKTIEFK